MAGFGAGYGFCSAATLSSFWGWKLGVAGRWQVLSGCFFGEGRVHDHF